MEIRNYDFCKRELLMTSVLSNYISRKQFRWMCKVGCIRCCELSELIKCKKPFFITASNWSKVQEITAENQKPADSDKWPPSEASLVKISQISNGKSINSGFQQKHQSEINKLIMLKQSRSRLLKPNENTTTTIAPAKTSFTLFGN